MSKGIIPYQPASYYNYLAEKERSKREAADRRHKKDFYKQTAPERNRETRLKKYSARNSRIVSSAEATRTGMNLFSFLKPALVFMLIVIFVVGIGFGALTNIIRAIGYWWIAIIILVLYAFKYR